MKAVVTTAAGGFERLKWTEVPVPEPGPGEVLLQVLAAGINNTDINTRLGWYAPSVTAGTDGATETTTGGGWNQPTPFPLIQGTDCCGRVVAVGDGVDAARIGERVLVRPCMRPHGFESPETVWLGVDFDGAFAEFVKVPAAEAFRIDCDWSDAELAAVPCAWGTAENMLHRARVTRGMRVLVTGASGGVGSAAVQLARRRGAEVIAITSADKCDALRALGATQVLTRDNDTAAALGPHSVDVVVDNVVGPGFGALLGVLRWGGVYVTSGAIAGPQVTLDMRELYLHDLTLLGCTAWDEPVFPQLIRCIEQGELRPLVHRTYPLQQIVAAQQDFLTRRHIGKLVLLP